ncbi:hypothetical protein CFE70_001757 [Pyrenophora teres f. teres 0-1]
MDLQEKAGWDAEQSKAEQKIEVNGAWSNALHTYKTWPIAVETDVSGRGSRRMLEIAHDSAGAGAGVMARWPLPGAAFAMRRLVTNVTGPGWPRPQPAPRPQPLHAAPSVSNRALVSLFAPPPVNPAAKIGGTLGTHWT